MAGELHEAKCIDDAAPSRHVSEEQFECNVCGDLLACKNYLASHMFKAHKRGQEMRRYVPYPTTHCEVCLLERFTRVELLRHLVRRSPTCGANLMMRYAPANLRITREWDEAAIHDPARSKGKAKLKKS